MAHIAILGGGTAGTLTANRLRRLYAGDVRARRTTITVVDQDDRHVYQPGLLFLPFGIHPPEQLVRSRRQLVHRDVRYLRASVDRVVSEESTVHFGNGASLRYDVLVIATGARLAPEETEGLTGPGWGERMFQFYTLDGATKLREALGRFRGGRLVVNVVDVPIKCPVAPLEFAFLADDYFTRRGIRDRVQISYVTPLDNAFTKPNAARALSNLLRDKGIELVTEFSTGRVDGEAGSLTSWDEREIPFDLLVAVPLHAGAEYVARSPGLGDDLGFVFTDPHTLQAKAAPNVFAIGDATNLPASKAGSVAHFEGAILTENVRHFLGGEPLTPDFDGHANCFVETGFGKALLLDFNYDVEPLPGTFPIPGVGPLRLLRESRLNHLAKLAFRWVYWNVLLPGYDVPGIGARMSLEGKEQPTAMPPLPPATVQGADEQLTGSTR